MKYDVLYNFISPVTGRIKVDQGYIIVGDKDNIGMPSPILIDIRQDIIDLRRKLGGFEELNKLDHNRIWIGDYNNEPVEQLHIGVINLPPLAEAVFPNPISPITGDFRIPNPTFDYLSPFDWAMSGPFLPQIYATKYDTFGNPTGTDVSSSLAMTQVRAAQIMKRFDNANFIVGSSTVDFNWENPEMYNIPEPLKQLYGLGTTYTFTKAQSLGALETGLLKNTVNFGTGTLSKAKAGKIPFLDDYVDPLSLQEEIEATIAECKTFATVKATEAKIESIAYFTGQMFPYVPSTIPFSGIGYQITYAIAAAAAIATAAKDSADDANTRIDNLSVAGDVIGTNMGSDTIVTVFTPNPRFTGKEYIKIPAGNILERPSIPEQGMLRYNIEI